MSETTATEAATETDVKADLDTMKVKIAGIEARLTHLEAGFEYHSESAGEAESEK